MTLLQTINQLFFVVEASRLNRAELMKCGKVKASYALHRFHLVSLRHAHFHCAGLDVLVGHACFLPATETASHLYGLRAIASLDLNVQAGVKYMV